MPVELDWKSTLVIIGGIIVVYYIAKNETSKALTAISDPKNPVNTGAVSAYQAVTGSNQDMGSDFFDATHNPDGTTKWWASPLSFLDSAITGN